MAQQACIHLHACVEAGVAHMRVRRRVLHVPLAHPSHAHWYMLRNQHLHPALHVPAAAPTDDDLLASIAAEKAAVTAALQNPEAAADAYFATLNMTSSQLKSAGKHLPAHLAVLDTTDTVQLRRTFKQNLKEVARLNKAAGDDLAYGITSLMHLSRKQYEKMYLTGRKKVTPAARSAVAQRVQQQGVSAKGER